MKKNILVLLVLLQQLYAVAQQTGPTVVNNAGGHFNNGTVFIDWNIGETMTATLTGNPVLTLGTLQPFTVTGSGSLPVTGLRFTAIRANSVLVMLEWETIQEFNNTGFYVERQDGNNNTFKTIRFVPSNAPGGNSASIINYSITDSNSYIGTSLYRLKQVDIDGKATWSAVRTVKGESELLPSLKIWPVPSSNVVYFKATGVKAEKYQVIDAAGRLIRQGGFKPGQSVTIDGLPKGYYYLRIADEKILSAALIIQ